MLWVAFDRGLRLAEKRNFPCPNRNKWLEARDFLYEEIMEKGYNKEMKCFVQSYENNTMLDSSILIAPLVFFIAPNDPRFLNTMDRIMLPPDKGGLTSTGLVYRYDTELSEDGTSSPFPSPSSSFVSLISHSLRIKRRRRPRRRLLNVHLLAGRGYDPREHVRAEIPRPSSQPLREHARLLEPPAHVLRGDLPQRRAAGQHAPGV